MDEEVSQKSETNQGGASSQPVSTPSTPGGKGKAVILIIVALIVLAAIGGGVYYFLYRSDETNTTANNEATTLGAVLENYIEACKLGDLEKISQLIYYEEELKNAELLEMMPSEQIDLRKSELMREYSDIEYTIQSQETEGSNVVLLVAATKDGRSKKERPFYLIQDNGEWKINIFGWNHPPDTSVDSPKECALFCKEKGFSYSDSMFDYSTSDILHDESSKECFCWIEPPDREDLSHLDINECEEFTSQDWLDIDSCYLLKAKSDENEEYCKKIRRKNRDSCYEQIAEIKMDASICDYLWDDEECLETVQQENGDLFSYLFNPEEWDLEAMQVMFNDEDNDGLNLFGENWFGTFEDEVDSDEDGYNDGDEIKNDYHPQGIGTKVDFSELEEECLDLMENYKDALPLSEDRKKYCQVFLLQYGLAKDFSFLKEGSLEAYESYLRDSIDLCEDAGFEDYKIMRNCAKMIGAIDFGYVMPPGPLPSLVDN